MSEPALCLQHINVPARDPLGLAKWYADTFGLRADEHRVRGPQVLIVFQKGEPVNRSPELHFGLRVPNRAVLDDWAQRLGGEIGVGPEFTAFKVYDPEGNCLELYAPTDS
jgi:catechol-2,3-dioxygenase